MRPCSSAGLALVAAGLCWCSRGDSPLPQPAVEDSWCRRRDGDARRRSVAPWEGDDSGALLSGDSSLQLFQLAARARLRAAGQGSGNTSVAALAASKANFSATTTPLTSASAATVLQHSAVARGQGAAAHPDTQDMAVILPCMMFMAFLYFLSGACLFIDPEANHRQESIPERFAHAVGQGWARPQAGVLEKALPALSGQFLHQSADMPLLVPMGPLQELRRSSKAPTSWWPTAAASLLPSVTFSLEVLSSSFAALLTVRCRDASGRGQREAVEVVGQSIHGAPEHVLATVDSALEIRNSEGHLLGKLVASDNEFVLEEVGGRPPKWAIMPSHKANGMAFLVSSRPKGRLLAEVQPGSGDRAKYLQIMNSDGVDALLVLVCLLGITVFEPPQSKQQPPLQEASVAKAELRPAPAKSAEGLASGLLTMSQN